jgi:PleD family two-component response regulator
MMINTPPTTISRPGATVAHHSVSFGFAESEPTDSLQELIARADVNLLEARRSG